MYVKKGNIIILYYNTYTNKMLFYKFLLYIYFLYSYFLHNNNKGFFTVMSFSNYKHCCVYNKNHSYCIIDNLNKKKYCSNNIEKYIIKTPDIKNKKLITISPGGLNGFYMLGISLYIRLSSNFVYDEYIFSGSSAGAWNALFLSYNGDTQELYKKLIKIIKEVNNDFKSKSFYTMSIKLKSLILEDFNDNDFNFEKLFIGITHLSNCFLPKTIIYTGFNNLNDAIDCCIASSHIPLLTGGILHKYRNNWAFDGGFSKYPYLHIIKPVLEITPDFWTKINTPSKLTPYLFLKSKFDIHKYTTMFSKNKYDLIKTFENGFLDTFKNENILKQILK